MGIYDDMLAMTPPEPKRHPRMPREQRAKQFMPFATLKGYSDAVRERSVWREADPTPDEDERALLDIRLADLLSSLADHPDVCVTLLDNGRKTVTGRLDHLSPAEDLGRVAGQSFRRSSVISLERI